MTEASAGQGTAASGHPPKYVALSTRLCSTRGARLYVLLQVTAVTKREIEMKVEAMVMQYG
jgi:hypothetical protein